MEILCNFASMTALAGEIRDFLMESGIGCVAESRCGADVLLAGRKYVVPWPVAATGQAQAREQAALLEQLLKELAGPDAAVVVITEDRWRRQGGMMRARLLAHLDVFIPMYARNCEVRKIDKETAAAFLAVNHSYGDAACRYRYGLYLKRYTGKSLEISRLASLARNDSGGSFARNDSGVEPGSLVAVATFSNARKWQKGDKTIRSYEWTRYASLPGVRISGGMGKMLQAFIQDQQPDDIMSYADLEWSEGAVYEQLGFALEGRKEPVLFCIDQQWGRSPVRPGITEIHEAARYFQNLGSNKYRLKITEYE